MKKITKILKRLEIIETLKHEIISKTYIQVEKYTWDVGFLRNFRKKQSDLDPYKKNGPQALASIMICLTLGECVQIFNLIPYIKSIDTNFIKLIIKNYV